MKGCMFLLIMTLGRVAGLSFDLGNVTFDYNNVPQLDPKAWWGPEHLKGHEDTSIRPFLIKFDEQMIADLRYRLKNHRSFTPALQGAGFTYGFNSGVIGSWIHYWAEEYPFEERERFLNQFPMFKTNIQGLDIHFIWIRPEVRLGVKIIPVLMMHGWPGSIREFYETIPLLTAYPNGRDFAIELIVPALPGFGFSDGAVRPGLGAPEAGVVMRNLMRRLGHKRFYVQGGDFGSLIGSYMANMYPEDLLGFHTNFAFLPAPLPFLLHILGSIAPPLVVDPALADRMYPLSTHFEYLIEETGYLHEQATKPDSIGIGFSDSPTALLAYILEKFSLGTDSNAITLPDGGLRNMNKEHLIDNLMFYWAPNSMTTAMRFYAETFNKKFVKYGFDSIPTSVPTWALQAKNELVYQSPLLLRTKYTNLLNATALDFGGHFFAFQLPQVFANNVFEALAAFRRWHKDDQDHTTNKINNDSVIAAVQELLRRLNSAMTEN